MLMVLYQLTGVSRLNWSYNMYTVDQYMKQNGKDFWSTDMLEPDEAYEGLRGYRSLHRPIREDVMRDMEMVKLFMTVKKKKKKTINHAWDEPIERAWED